MNEKRNEKRMVWAARAAAAAGALLVACGAGMVYRPAGLIVAGVLLLVVGVGALR